MGVRILVGPIVDEKLGRASYMQRGKIIAYVDTRTALFAFAFLFYAAALIG